MKNKKRLDRIVMRSSVFVADMTCIALRSKKSNPEMHGLGLTWFSGSIVIARRYWYIWSDCKTEINAKYGKDRRQEPTRGAIH